MVNEFVSHYVKIDKLNINEIEGFKSVDKTDKTVQRLDNNYTTMMVQWSGICVKGALF